MSQENERNRNEKTEYDLFDNVLENLQQRNMSTKCWERIKHKVHYEKGTFPPGTVNDIFYEDPIQEIIYIAIEFSSQTTLHTRFYASDNIKAAAFQKALNKHKDAKLWHVAGTKYLVYARKKKKHLHVYFYCNSLHSNPKPSYLVPIPSK